MPSHDPLIEQLQAEMRRVGITWAAVAETARLNEGLEEPPESFAMDLGAFLPLLRSLPDGAGQDRFLDAVKAAAEPALERARRAEALTRKRERQSRKPPGGRAGV